MTNTEDQDSAARLADRGDDWRDLEKFYYEEDAETLRQALHDRDRYQRDAEWWREECIRLTGESLA